MRPGWPRWGRLGRPARALVYLAWLLGTSVPGAYLLFTAHRSAAIYGFLKSPHLGVRGRVHQPDPELGWIAVPGARGEHVFPVGEPIPMRYDDAGFRIPAAADPHRDLRRPLVLAFGCSFTYGDGCREEDTYPERVAAALHGTCLNAGKCAYGLAQMLLLARELVPRHRPEYVLVQSSPWLVGRGLSPFARSTFGAVTAPYFTEGPEGALAVQPPPFMSRLFTLPIPDYDGTPASGADRLSFFTRVGLPLHLHDDMALAAHRLRQHLGQVPPPHPRAAEVVRLAYAEIGRLCREAGSRMVVVRLSQPLDQSAPLLGLPRAERPLVALAQRALNAAVPEKTKAAYQRQFAHWRGDPPVLVDTHPNPRAHELIARVVLAALAEGRPASAPP